MIPACHASYIPPRESISNPLANLIPKGQTIHIGGHILILSLVETEVEMIVFSQWKICLNNDIRKDGIQFAGLICYSHDRLYEQVGIGTPGRNKKRRSTLFQRSFQC